MADKSKVLINADGQILDIEKVKAVLKSYWLFSPAEKEAFNALKDRADLKVKFLTTI